MRKALNENPRVQLGVLGVIAVVFAIMLYTTVLSGSSTTPPAGDPAAATAGAPPVDPAAAAPATPAPATPAPATPDPATSAPSQPPATTSAEGLVPTQGLPEDVLVALAKGDAVALIVYDPEAISDRQVRIYTDRLESNPKVSVFDSKAKNIADYSRITEGVSVSRTPALVVVSPRKGSDQLVGSVSYGFRSAKSIDTALDDALYGGANISAAP